MENQRCYRGIPPCPPPESPILGISGAPCPSTGEGGPDPAGFQAAQPSDIVGGRLEVELQRRPSQANGAHTVAAQMLEAGEHMFDTRPAAGDAGVASLLAGRQRLALGRLTLNVRLESGLPKPRLPGYIHVTLVSVEVFACVAIIQHILKLQGGVRSPSIP